MAKKIWASGDEVDAADLNGNFEPSNTDYIYGETIAAGGAPLYLKASDGKLYNASAASANEAFYNYVGLSIEGGLVNEDHLIASIEGTIVTVPSMGAMTATVSSTTDISLTSHATTSVGIAGNVTSGSSGGPSGKFVFVTGKIVANLTALDMWLNVQGAGAGALTATIYLATPVSGGFSYGSSLGTATISSPTSSAVNTFTFGTPIVVKPNTYYAVEFTAASGSSGNGWQIGGNGSVTAANGFYLTSSDGTTTVQTNVNFYLVTYYTATQSYAVGDNVFMSDTSGAISPIFQGTNPLVVGRVLSSTSIIIDKSPGLKLIGSTFFPKSSLSQSSGTTPVWVPWLKNATRVVISVTAATPSSGATTFERRISDNPNASNMQASVGSTNVLRGNALATGIGYGSTDRELLKLQCSGTSGGQFSDGAIAYFYR